MRMVARRGSAVAVVLLNVAFMIGASSALAASPAAGFTIGAFATPSYFAAAGDDAYRVTVRNAGSLPTNGELVTLSDGLPEGLTVQKIEFFRSGVQGDHGGELCSTVSVQCHLPLAVAADETLSMVIHVTVSPGTPGTLTDTAHVSGGGAPEVSASIQTPLSTATPPFGVAMFAVDIAGPDGLADTQAAAHPYELTAAIDLENAFRIGPGGSLQDTSVQDVKDVVIDLPLGFLASALATPKCTFAQLSSRIEKGEGGCSPNSVVGHILTEPAGGESLDGPIYNMVPEHGVPAEFAYVDSLASPHVLYASVVPSAAGYVLRLTAPDLPQAALTGVAVTLFGDPATRDGGANSPLPMLTNPSDCSAQPLVSSVHMDSWQNPGGYSADGTPDLGDPAWVSATSQSPPVTGCNLLQFTPELVAQPTTSVADSPSGLELELRSRQTEDVQVNATPPLHRALVTLPEGMTIDPSAGDGLRACSEAQIGWVGPSLSGFTAARPQCPQESKIGSLEMTTPLFAGVLTGALYLAAQDANPFQSVLAAYVVVDDPLTGVVLKIAGELRADPRTGRLTVVLAESPQLPFSDLKLHFFGGSTALLATPQSCGTYTTDSELAPWSIEGSELPATPFDSFAIDSGCVSGFAPTFTGGGTSLQAGAATSLQASFSRQDSDQQLAGWSVSLPPGLLADVGGVPLCPEAAASAGSCPEASQVGTVLVGAGSGPNPLFVPGRAYLTGPYNGGAYGLSLVVPVIAGPFDFGTVVMRASVRIDPHTAQVTVVSDPFPTILDVTGANGQVSGIPIRLRRVDVELNRPGFMLNPTNCNPMALDAAISSAQGAGANVSSRFQVANCATLKFTPKLTALTRANGEFAGHGASLHLVIVSRAGQANMRSLKVDLPQRLPARLETIQHACPERIFNASPASCPKASLVGQALVQTPMLASLMAGSAILVSHGAAFPNLVLVLKAQGVTIDLTGAVYVDARNVTSVTFRAIPDVPIRRLDLILPEGSRSIFAASASLCKSPLRMSTAITAQDNARVKPTVKVAVSGCKKPKRPKKKPHPTRRKR